MIPTKEEIRTRFENYIREYEEKIKLWKNVKVVTKKDGTPFKDFNRNFEGADVVRPAYGFGDIDLVVVNYKIRIAGNHVTDTIHTRELVKYTKLNPSEDRIIKETYLEPYFYLTIPEIMEKIQRTIQIYEKNIEEYKDQIEKLDWMYDEVVTRINDTMDYIRENAGGNTSLYYELRGCIQKVGY